MRAVSSVCEKSFLLGLDIVAQWVQSGFMEYGAHTTTEEGAHTMNHLYTFSLRYSNNESRYVGISAIDLACAESMARLHKHAGEPPLRCILVTVDREGDGCGDERCAVCHPSSRNDHSASRRLEVLQAEAPHLIAARADRDAAKYFVVRGDTGDEVADLSRPAAIRLAADTNGTWGRQS